jgi:arylsulfatase A-like enzyme
MVLKFFTILYLIFPAITVFGSNEIEKQNSLKPNIIVLFFDDVGYGDLSCYGHPIIQTPNIDNLAKQGIRFTSFLTGSTCVPSRTQLITGRYMPRIDFGGGTGPGGEGGLPDSEITLAEGLKKAGYNTGMIGKWHLGPKDQLLPTNKGFDEWFGMPYSNDFRKPWVQTDVPLGLFRGTEMVEYPINQSTLTKRYTEEATKFINKNSNKNNPFFLYLAYNMAHLPIYTADEFLGQSKAGLYGDVLAELDWSVGQILKTLKDNMISENTIIFLASDNGPWMDAPDRMFLKEHNKPWYQGTAGLLRGSKGSSYEGGCRVPAIICWPKIIPEEKVKSELIGMPDIYLTLMKIGGAELPDHALDGYDLIPFLTGEQANSPRNKYVYIGRDLEAMRVGDWKLRLKSGKPELFNIQLDPSERYNRADEKHEIVHQIYKEMIQSANDLNIKVSESCIKIDEKK